MRLASAILAALGAGVACGQVRAANASAAGVDAVGVMRRLAAWWYGGMRAIGAGGAG